MSMMAQFVQVTRERLDQLLAEPSTAFELFQTSAGDFSESVYQEVQRGAERLQQAAAGGQLAKLLASSLATLDPAMRQRLEQHLGTKGVDVGGLKGGQGGDAILKFMNERLGPLPLPTAPSGGSRPKDQTLSLDKAWHGVHFLLCGQAEPGTTVLSQVVLGGTELGEDLGYGPARYFSVDETAASARALSRADLEAEMKARFDPALMSSMDIYPGGWDFNGVGWPLAEFRRLRDFYVAAAAQGRAVVTCIV